MIHPRSSQSSAPVETDSCLPGPRGLRPDPSLALVPLPRHQASMTNLCRNGIWHVGPLQLALPIDGWDTRDLLRVAGPSLTLFDFDVMACLTNRWREGDRSPRGDRRRQRSTSSPAELGRYPTRHGDAGQTAQRADAGALLVDQRPSPAAVRGARRSRIRDPPGTVRYSIRALFALVAGRSKRRNQPSSSRIKTRCG
jgi:hypothetical protein